MREIYLKQASMLLEILPVLNEFEMFALKGGTAINFFYQNAPRLSIDIDLNYLPIEPRQTFLLNLTDSLTKMAETIDGLEQDIFVKKFYTKKDKQLSKLLVSKGNIDIKIEPNLVLRGYVFKPSKQRLCQNFQNQIFQSFHIKTMSKADVYAGKICAALDRQHPRDLFDIKLLLDNEGISDDMRKAFVIYLASGSRPMHELLNPNLIDIEERFFKEFDGMTNIPVTLDELLKTRKQLVTIIQKELTENERRFLLSIKLGEPDWELIDVPHAQQLPAIQWKLRNIQMLDSKKKNMLAEKLKRVLDL